MPRRRSYSRRTTNSRRSSGSRVRFAARGRASRGGRAFTASRGRAQTVRIELVTGAAGGTLARPAPGVPGLVGASVQPPRRRMF